MALALSDPADVVSLANKPNKLRQGFVSLAETLLSSISDVFPECQSTQSVLMLFQTMVKGNEAVEDRFIRRCHALFREHGMPLKERDPEGLFSVVESLEYLKDIDLREKWEDPDFAQESRDHLWQYIGALKTYSNLYSAVPQNVMGKIETVAGTIGEQITRGEVDLTSMDLGSIGQGLLANMSPEELANFEGSLPEIYQSLSDAAGSLGGAAGGSGLDLQGLMAQMAAQSGEGGAPAGGTVDMARVLQQLHAQAPPGAGTPDLSQMMQALGPMLQSVQSIGVQGPSGRAAIRATPEPRRRTATARRKGS